MNRRSAFSALTPFIVIVAGCGESPTGSQLPPPAPPPATPSRLGTLGIDIQGIHFPYPGDAGTVTILRTDVSNATPQNLSIYLYPTEGYYTAQWVEPGTYRISYTPIAPYHLNEGQNSARDVGVSTLGTTWVTYTVTDTTFAGPAGSFAHSSAGGVVRNR